LSDAVGSSTFTYQNYGAFQSALATQSGPFGSDTITRAYTNRVPQSLTLAQPSGSWTQSYGFDSLQRLHTLASPAGTFTYNYYGAGDQIQTLALPGGNTIAESFDSAGQVVTNTLKHGTTALDAYVYTYDDDGRRTAVQRVDGATVNYGYDDIGQLTSAVGYEPDGVTQRANENLGYRYDAAGNLQQRSNNTLLQGFQTDNANQLVNVTRDNDLLTVAGSVSNNVTGLAINGQSAALYHDLTYAVAGGVALANNLNSFTGVVTSAGHLLTNVLTTELPLTVSLRYDANGNLIWDGLTAYSYDCANELASATVTNCWRTQYAYDGLGRRRVRQDFAWSGGGWAETNEVHYVYDGMTVLQERNSNNVPVVTYTRGTDLSGTPQGAGGIGGLLARTDANGSAFYHADGNGNITALVNGSGTVVAKYLYDSFGNTLGMWGSLAAANPYRYSSKEQDPRSGLYYYGYRWYAPNLQRWVNRDPIGEWGGINLYGFVGNAPIDDFDPKGLQQLDFDFDFESPGAEAEQESVLQYEYMESQPAVMNQGPSIGPPPETQAEFELGIAKLAQDPNSPLNPVNLHCTAANNGFSTAGRVAELQNAIPPSQQGRITMAVGLAEDANGVRQVLIGTSEPMGYLRPGVTLNPGETLAPGLGHAEEDIVNFAQQNNLNLLEVGATRPICTTCAPIIQQAGATPVTPLKGP
jgi:RHS repeat-associated protein